jgi:hypothetical protein
LARSSRKPNQGDLLVVHNHLGGPGHLVVDRVSKKMTRAVDFWVGFDLGYLLVAGKIRMNLVGQRPLNRPLAGGHLAVAEFPGRSLAALGGSLNLHSRVAVAF